MNRLLTRIGFGILYAYSQLVAAQPGAFFTLSTAGTNLSITTTVPNHLYEQAGIKILTPGYSIQNLGTDCNMAANGYCIFPVSQTQPHSLAISGPKGDLDLILCLNGNGPVSCQRFKNIHFSPNTFAYVVSTSTFSLASCPVDNSSGQLGTCQNAIPAFTLPAAPNGVVLNKMSTKAYINSENSRAVESSITTCDVDSETGILTNCASANIASPADMVAQQGLIAPTPDDSQLFVLSDISFSSVRIAACPLNTSSTNLTCTDTGAILHNNSSTGITLNKAGTTAYVGGNNGGLPLTNHYVDVCSVNGTSFSNCIGKKGDGSSISFDPVYGVALNKTETLIYVVVNEPGSRTSVPGIIYGCSTTPNNTNFFDSCFTATQSAINNAQDITLNADNTYAYITDANRNVYTCPININGTFGSCIPTTDPLFSSTYGIALG